MFSKFDSLLKGVKNNTVSAIPDDRSSVLQQVLVHRFHLIHFLMSTLACFCYLITLINCLTGGNVCFEREEFIIREER